MSSVDTVSLSNERDVFNFTVSSLVHVYVDWVRLFLNCGHQGAYCSSSRWHMENHGGIILTRETEELGEKNLSQFHFFHTFHLD
jgi:hypothetical protein